MVDVRARGGQKLVVDVAMAAVGGSRWRQAWRVSSEARDRPSAVALSRCDQTQQRVTRMSRAWEDSADLGGNPERPRVRRARPPFPRRTWEHRAEQV
jgi:hypothetical protein